MPSRKTEKTEQILKGAMEQFLQYGYDGASMDRIAAAAGVAKQTLYSYFQDKETLFLALVEKMTKERFRLIFGEKPLEGEPKLVLRHLASNLLSQIIEDKEYHCFARLVIGESGRFPELGQTVIRNITQPGIKILSHYLASHPELKLDDPEEIAAIFLGSLIYFALTQEILHGKNVMPRNGDRLIDSLVNLIC